MDLKEFSQHDSGNVSRHPWELARIQALAAIIRRFIPARTDVGILDIGCGDGFAVSALARLFQQPRTHAVDIHLNAAALEVLRTTRPDITFYSRFEEIPPTPYDLILLLDVLEHIEDDSAFLEKIAGKHVSADGFLLVTVPAFQSLFSSHDQFLHHIRRYNRTQIIRIMDNTGLSVIASGYLFSSLLPLRLGRVALEKLGLLPAGSSPQGVANWRHGPLLTTLASTIMKMDNYLQLRLNKLNLHLPGLTIWLLAQKQQ